jgi:hypothetical protein
MAECDWRVDGWPCSRPAQWAVVMGTLSCSAVKVLRLCAVHQAIWASVWKGAPDDCVPPHRFADAVMGQLR